MMPFIALWRKNGHEAKREEKDLYITELRHTYFYLFHVYNAHHQYCWFCKLTSSSSCHAIFHCFVMKETFFITWP
jgi:hypothetical protein